MAINWRWDEQSPHQGQCPSAYLYGEKCLCMESTQGNIHVIPDWQEHDASSECPCFPSISNISSGNELVWVHQVFS